MTKVIRIDPDVHSELLRRRLPGERNFNGAIERSLEQTEMEHKLRTVGLSTTQMARLWDLRAANGSKP